jgi:hypothetical protein
MTERTKPNRTRKILAFLAVVVVLAGGVLAGTQLSSKQVVPQDQPVLAAGMETITACASAENRFGCLQAAAAALPVSEVETIESFFRAVADDRLGPHCYGAAQVIGERAFTRFGLEAVSAGVPACQTGYQHGMMIAAASAGIGLDEVARTCDRAEQGSQEPDRWTSSMKLTCLVGVGRGVAVVTEDISSGRDLCESVLSFDRTLADDETTGVDFCVRGVVNDTINAESDVNESLRQCIELGGTRGYGCVSLGLRIPAAAVEEKTAELAEACAKVPADYSSYCYFALGDALAERLTITDQTAPENALRACESSEFCAGHFAKFVLNTTWDPQYAIEACNLLPGRGAVVCKGSIPSLVDGMIQQGHLPADKAVKLDEVSDRS